MEDKEKRETIKKIERLAAIKEETSKLGDERLEIEKSLPDLFIYNKGTGEKPWVRFTRTDNAKELLTKGVFFRRNAINLYTTELEFLKNEPKELKEKRGE